MSIITPCKLIENQAFNNYQQIRYYGTTGNKPNIEIRILTFECNERKDKKPTKYQQMCIFWQETGLFIWLPYKEFIFYKSYLIFESSNFALLKLSDGLLTITSPLYKYYSIQEGTNDAFDILNHKCGKNFYPERFMGIDIENYASYNIVNPEQYFLDCPSSGSKIICSIYTDLHDTPKKEHIIKYLPYTDLMSCPPTWDDWNEPYGKLRPPIPIQLMKHIKKIKKYWFIWIDNPYARRIICLDNNFEFLKGSLVKKYSKHKIIEDINEISKNLNLSEKNIEIYQQLLRQRALYYYCIAEFDQAIADITKILEITPDPYIYSLRAFLHNINKNRDASRKDQEIASQLLGKSKH